MGWNCTPVLTRTASGPAIEAMKHIINRTLIEDIGFTLAELSYVFANHGRKRVHRLRPFLAAVIGKARPDVQNTKTLIDQIRKLLPAQSQTMFASSLRLSTIRTGAWVESVDGPALERAIYMMARLGEVYPHVVASFIRDPKSVGPETMDLGEFGTVRRVSRFDPKWWFVVGIFATFSKRSDPWEVQVGDAASTHYNGIYQLMLSNLTSVRTSHSFAKGDELPDIKWNDRSKQRKLASMLNGLACSSQHPMPSLNIAQDEWEHWRKLLTGDTRRSLLSDPVRLAFDALLRDAWNNTFPSVPIVPKFLVSRVKGIVESLIRINYEDTATEGIALRFNLEAYQRIAM